MDEFGFYLCLDSIVWASCAVSTIGCRILGVWVATLYHEVFDDTMEYGAIIIALLGELYEVVAMEWCLVVEANNDVAHGS